MIVAFQGRCPACGHDTARDAEALAQYKEWFERRVQLEGDLEIGVGQQAAVSDDKQVGIAAGDEPKSVSGEGGR